MKYVGKKILVLGIGPSQVDLITLCKDFGMTVYAVAYEDSGPGKALVDEFQVIDIKNIPAVEAYAREKQVDFVFTMASEVGVMTTAVVSENLDLPRFISSHSANFLSNKTKWRQMLGEIEGNVSFRAVSSIDELKDWTTFPAIIKPADSSGQRGVHLVHNQAELTQHFERSISFSRSGQLIVEEFVDGPEISVNALFQAGELRYYFISDRISYGEYPGGIIKEHYLPSRVVDKETEQRIKRLVEEVSRKSGFEDGHVYFQIKLDQGMPKLIEYTPRFDGCHMWRLIKHATGVDLRQLAMEWLVLGESVSLLESQPTYNGDYTLQFISDFPGTTFEASNYPLKADPLYLEWYYEDGQIVNTVTGFIEKAGYAIFKE